MKPPTRKQKTLLVVLALVALAGIAYFAFKSSIIRDTVILINARTPTPLFLLLMVILPVFGFPLSVFLVALGIKFGLATSLLIMFAIMPLHLGMSYGLARIAGNIIQRILAKKDYQIPQIPPHRHLRFCFLVAAIPVAPYAVKNYLLPLAGIPFWIYLGMNWVCQGLLAVPAVVLGNSLADLNPVMFISAIAAIIIIYLLISRLERKYGKQVDLKASTN